MHYKQCLRYILIFSMFLLITCKSNDTPTQGMVQDLLIYPQDVQIYAKNLSIEPPLSFDDTHAKYAHFKEIFFHPWNLEPAKHNEETTPKHTEEKIELPMVSVFENDNLVTSWWAENLLPWTSSNLLALEDNQQQDTYPSRNDLGIIVERTSARGAPTYKPFFKDITLAGEGFPFDYLTRSNLQIGMPVRITHTSRDQAWVFVETELVSGWVPQHVVALVSSEIIARFMAAPQASIIHDNVTLHSTSGVSLGLGFLGSVLPIDNETIKEFTLLVPIRETTGHAKIVTATVQKEDAVRIPQVFTPENLASIANCYINQPYGWGGSFGNRDCSEFLKDLFIPFGIWLPRNSASQIKAWNFIEVTDPTEETVKELLATKGIPFYTFIGFKGHIGLYLGMYNNTPVMLHDFWGIRTLKDGKEGRFVLGRVVITSLTPGSELPDVDKKHRLVDKVIGISVFHEEQK